MHASYLTSFPYVACSEKYALSYRSHIPAGTSLTHDEQSTFFCEYFCTFLLFSVEQCVHAGGEKQMV